MTCEQLLKKLQAMTLEQLSQPVEVAVRTYTREYPDYCHAFDFSASQGRIYCSFGEGVTISHRRTSKTTGITRGGETPR